MQKILGALLGTGLVGAIAGAFAGPQAAAAVIVVGGIITAALRDVERAEEG